MLKCENKCILLHPENRWLKQQKIQENGKCKTSMGLCSNQEVLG